MTDDWLMHMRDSLLPSDIKPTQPDRHGWRSMESAPIKRPILGWGPGWLNASEIMIDDHGRAYSPDSGADVHPPPTWWRPMPSPPEDS